MDVSVIERLLPSSLQILGAITPCCAYVTFTYEPGELEQRSDASDLGLNLVYKDLVQEKRAKDVRSVVVQAIDPNDKLTSSYLLHSTSEILANTV